MNESNTQHLESYFTTYGWTFDSEKDGSLVSGWQGERRYYPLEVKTTDTWIMFQIKPLIEVNLEYIRQADVVPFLMELNSQLHLVKLAIDEDGEIVLRFQVLSSGFEYDHFNNIVGILGYYAELISDEILTKLTSFHHPLDGYYLVS